MQHQTLKQEAIESIRYLPDDADIDDIMYRLYVIDKLHKSRTAIEHGQVIAHDDLQCEIDMHLAAQGGDHKGDLSRFIEEAVRAYLFEQAVEQAKAAAAGMSAGELVDLIDEAVQWVRER